MKTAKMKKVLLAMSLGLGLSGAFAGSASAQHSMCPDWEFDCAENNNAFACNMFFKYCRDRPLP